MQLQFQHQSFRDYSGLISFRMDWLDLAGHTLGNCPAGVIGQSLEIFLSVVSSVQLLSCVQLFVTPCTAVYQASLSITNSWSLLKPMSIESMMPSNHLILCCPFSHLQSFPASESFPMSQLFTSGGQSIGVSALAQEFAKFIW